MCCRSQRKAAGWNKSEVSKGNYINERRQLLLRKDGNPLVGQKAWGLVGGKGIRAASSMFSCTEILVPNVLSWKKEPGHSRRNGLVCPAWARSAEMEQSRPETLGYTRKQVAQKARNSRKRRKDEAEKRKQRRAECGHTPRIPTFGSWKQVIKTSRPVEYMRPTGKEVC